ncbi:ABC transporter ATP-binding protein [Pedococcus sp.]|uniref:ABC transporter ATP-binding protein n=1 Tax=Pedococcus sp. TaxID=2860345 RepID=UPI002E12603F|nr:ABC transporter ATP-binding protein [Pedococcus sp.]
MSADLSSSAKIRPEATGAALSTRELTAGYNGRPVVHGVSVNVEPGQVVSIVGPNGSGKSTLLKSIVGVVKVLSGSVLLDGVDIANTPPEDIARTGVGYVPQIDDVFGPLSVKENLEMGGYLLPQREVAGRIERVVTYFPKLGTMMTRRAAQLSGGERKMLAMGRVLMLQPSLFVLDEPTANLAPLIAMELLHEHVRQLAVAGASVLIVEQRAKAVLEISDHTYVLAGGRLRMEGSPTELATSPDFVASFLGGGAAGSAVGSP